MLASASIVACFSGPHVCSLASLIAEYGWEKDSYLDACFKVEKLLVHFDVVMDPPLGTLGLDDQRVLKRKHPLEVASSRLRSLIEGGESHQTEFKASIYINTRRRDELLDASPRDFIDEKLREKAAREIAAFLNSDGGAILFGVTDDGKVRGCED
jgi:hypothetical protein